MKRSAVVVGDESVGVDRRSLVDGHDQIDVARPRAFGVEARRLRGMVGMAVVVAHDVEPCGVCLALDPDVVARIDLVAITRALDHDVARPFHGADGAVIARADHDAADLLRVAFRAVRADRLESVARDLQRLL